MAHTHTHTHWLITDKGDQDVRVLADRHYSRQTVGDRQFARNGQNLVFITADSKAAWITFRPTAGKAVRKDGLDAWECALFRNEGPVKASILIREAVELSIALWGPWPIDGLLTYVKPECVKTEIPGYCFIRAGWKKRRGADGEYRTASDGKPMFWAPHPKRNCFELFAARLAGEWAWKTGRGGRLREFFQGCAEEEQF